MFTKYENFKRKSNCFSSFSLWDCSAIQDNDAGVEAKRPTGPTARHMAYV